VRLMPVKASYHTVDEFEVAVQYMAVVCVLCTYNSIEKSGTVLVLYEEKKFRAILIADGMLLLLIFPSQELIIRIVYIDTAAYGRITILGSISRTIRQNI
jgi:hypothetical protein